MQRRRRIAAYGICQDADGRVLLVRASPRSNTPGVWSLPGGGIDHGEHPADAAVREIAEETGLTVTITGLRGVVSDITEMPWRGVAVHHDRIVYDVVPNGGTLRGETDGTSDLVAWHGQDELAALPLMPYAAELLGVPDAATLTDAAGTRPAVPDTAGEADAKGWSAFDEGGRPHRGRRFATYGLTTDTAGRVLLTRIAQGYPGAGRWHLPGGGTDYGEQPETALLRELAEETGQVGRVTRLLDVSHRHNPAALGPEGYPIDFHAVRALFRVVVDAATPARVTEAAGGSTAEARWLTEQAARGLRLTEIATDGLARLARERGLLGHE
ncbi:MAG TPA: NUDIX domain-containing protein [Micromonosporaceae bacterium]